MMSGIDNDSSIGRIQRNHRTVNFFQTLGPGSAQQQHQGLKPPPFLSTHFRIASPMLMEETITPVVGFRQTSDGSTTYT
ncbi:hypothetical protein NPIL_237741 [Nephila pilipes]|uniref:Uncharacterized protein n=1 Tax=Nephila pilipes TaxID=299642 RepID=A0A8X6PB68_NEPPI|nr:hypothetical protein NPIL_237741 [Nephila pilipes]